MAAPTSSSPKPALTGEQASKLLWELAGQLDSTVAASRKVLLGTRKLGGPSCVQPATASELKGAGVHIPRAAGGGAGTAFPVFHEAASRASAKADFVWQQTRLRPMLEQLRGRSARAAGPAQQVYRKAQALAAAAAAWKKWPTGLTPTNVPKSTHWPGVCLRAVNDAAAAKDLIRFRRWAYELAAATFALTDLHRWNEFLLGNYAESLAYQARCQDVFIWANAAYVAAGAKGPKYNAMACYDNFPASALAIAMTDNLLEVERQAERLCLAPKAFAGLVAKPLGPVPAAVWMPPDLRAGFVLLRSRLSPGNRGLWDRAASMPFERSYLANMLFRMSAAKVTDELGSALARFDKLHPSADLADLADLMDVLFYRGSTGGGHVWADRFDSRLMAAAGHFAGNGRDALLRAHALTNELLGNWTNYKAYVRTLREALDEKKLDCVRGTDMIGCLFRNAGRGGFLNVHLSFGLASHWMGAAEAHANGVRATLLADSLAPQAPRGVWPSALFHGFEWPKGYPQWRGPAFSAELCARGLDNYIFVEGYIIRGRNAGQLVRAAVPYLPGRETAEVERIYGGPYPDVPPLESAATVTPRD